MFENSIARHHVKADKSSLKLIAAIRRNYAAQLNGSQTRSRARLAQFDDEKLLAALLHLPDRLLDEATNSKFSRQQAAYLAQVAAAIEFELFVPVRRTNLASLSFNRHINRVTIKGEPCWIIRFDPEETKNRSEIVFELSGASVRRIERAMRLYKQPEDGRLFSKAAQSLARGVKREVERHLGVPFHLHLFRGIAATLAVKEHANGLEVARALLGDRSEPVIRQNYTPTVDRHLRAQAQSNMQRMRIRTAPLVKFVRHRSRKKP